jgi:hypothetical protein
LYAFSSLDIILCPEFAIFMKELVVLRPVIWYIQIFGEPGLYTRTSFYLVFGSRD